MNEIKENKFLDFIHDFIILYIILPILFIMTLPFFFILYVLSCVIWIITTILGNGIWINWNNIHNIKQIRKEDF
jgi:hypothetical protein